MSTDTEDRKFNCLRQNALIIGVLIGVGTGFGLGFALRHVSPSTDAIIWIGLPGEVYMRMLKMTILPLVVSTIITGTASMDPKSNGRVSSISFAFIVLSNMIGAIIAIAVYFIFKPGEGVVIKDRTSSSVSTNIETSDMFADLIRNLFPDNLVTACFQKAQTKYTSRVQEIVTNGTNTTVTVVSKSVSATGGVNILGLIIVCSLLGLAVGQLEEQTQAFLAFFRAVSEIIIRVLRWIIWFTPVGVASLIAASILSVSDIGNTFSNLGVFVLALSVGIVFHQLFLIPVTYFITTRKNPLQLYAASVRPWLTVFAPPSTAVGMPEMLNTLENKLDVDKRISRFIVPLGAALERMGSCLFICLSALFLIKLEGTTLYVVDVLLIGLLSSVGSLAIPSIPSASIITILIVLSSLNVHVTSVGLLMALEWYSDRIRTTSNTMTIIVGAVIVDKLCGSFLSQLKTEEKDAFSAKTDSIKDSKDSTNL